MEIVFSIPVTTVDSGIQENSTPSVNMPDRRLIVSAPATINIFARHTVNKNDGRTVMSLHNLITPSCSLFPIKLAVVRVNPKLQQLHQR